MSSETDLSVDDYIYVCVYVCVSEDIWGVIVYGSVLVM